MNPPALNGDTAADHVGSPGLLLALAAVCLVAGLIVVSFAYPDQATRNGAKAVDNSARAARRVEVTCRETPAAERHPAQRARLLHL